MQGGALPDGERERIVGKLARYTGLSPAYIEQTDLRIEIHRFVKELLRDQKRTVGRHDSRFTGIDRDAAGENADYDPSRAAITGPYTASLNDYVRSELEFGSDLPYEILTGRVQPWGYDKHQNQYVNVAETLREAMTKSPFLKVFVAIGFGSLFIHPVQHPFQLRQRLRELAHRRIAPPPPRVALAWTPVPGPA